MRTPTQAFAIGTLHGLAGTGAVVLLLIAASPAASRPQPPWQCSPPMSILSMALLTGAFARLLTRPLIEPLYRSVGIPALGRLGVMFGLWHAGLT